MKFVSSIFLICLIQYAHLKPVSEPLLYFFDLTNTRLFDYVKDGGTPCDTITSISTIAYNRQNPGGVENVKEQDACNYIGSNKKVVFITHGFKSSPKTKYISESASQLIKNKYTVFAVNWTEGSCNENLSNYPPTLLAAYKRAARNTRKAGEFLADFIEQIYIKCKVPSTNIMLIGHSLGAHVSGFAAKNVKSRNIGTIKRIVGADPAGPLFKSNSCNQRLCETDAKHVIALHTTTDWGINKPIGLLNLYFNDGVYQPACGFWLDPIRICSHTIAVKYVAVLLENSNCGFPGVPKLEPFDKSKRPNSTDPYSLKKCIFVDRKIFEQYNITPGAYTVFLKEEDPFLCSQNTFPTCQQ